MSRLKSSRARVVRLTLIALFAAAPLAWFAWTVYAATRTWDGTGANNNWSTADNWVFGVVPANNDDLIFPDSAAQKSNNNDLASRTFNTISLQGSGFTLAGVAISLAAGINDTGVAGATNNVVSIPITLTAPQAFTSNASDRQLRIQGNVNNNGNTLTLGGTGNITTANLISGSGGLTKTGTGTATITGLFSHSFTGTTSVNEGTLLMSKGIANNSVSNTLVVGDGVGTANTAVARLASTGQIPDTGSVTVNSDGLFDLNGLNEGFGALTVNAGNVQILTGTLTGTSLTMTGGNISSTGAGKMVFGGNVTTNASASTANVSGNLDLGGGTRTFNIADGPILDLDVTAVISNGGLTKTGAGSLFLRANNTYAGATTISSGRVDVEGSQPQSAVTLLSGTLSGRGTVGSINATSGMITPGIGTSNFHLNVQGNLTLAPGVTYVATSAWPTPNNNGVLDVTGTVNLGDSTLDLQHVSPPSSLTPRPGLTILINSGDQAVQGTFNGLPEGSSFTRDGTTYYISYVGGDGNDVVLRVPATRTWDGQKDDGTASANANWMTKENWVGDVAPQVGDNLVFPANATKKLNFNDFPNGTTFTSITFSGGGYQLRRATSNNNINLTAGITDNNASSDFEDGNSIFSLAIGGPGGVSKNGAGHLGLLVSNNTYTGVTVINAGSLHITANQPSSPVNLIGGTLTGLGVTGAITASGGTVAPSNLRAQGPVNFNSAASYSARFVTTDDVISLTKLSVTGTINLGNSTLNCTHDNPPPVGNAFLVVENDDVDPVTGTFSGLPEGSLFTIRRADGTDPLTFRISYIGGTGNDVTLTRTATSTGPAILVEDGTNELAAVDSVTLVRGPFTLTDNYNFSSDNRTRIIFFTTDLGFSQITQPELNTLSVQILGNSYAVEAVGPHSTINGSFIVFRLPDLPPGNYPVGIRLNGVNSVNTPNLTIVAPP